MGLLDYLNQPSSSSTPTGRYVSSASKGTESYVKNRGPERQEQPRKRIGFNDMLKKAAGATAKAVGGYIDRDKKGIGINDLLVAPSRAAGDVGKAVVGGFVEPVKKLGHTANAAINQPKWLKLLEEGKIDKQAYDELTKEDYYKAGLKVDDKNMGRKVVGNLAENALNVVTVGKGGEIVKQGVRVGGKALAKQAAKQGVKQGAATGAAIAAQEDEITPGKAAAYVGGGAVAGAVGGAGLSVVSSAAGKLMDDTVYKAGRNLKTQQLLKVGRDLNQPTVKDPELIPAVIQDATTKLESVRRQFDDISSKLKAAQSGQTQGLGDPQTYLEKLHELDQIKRALEKKIARHQVNPKVPLADQNLDPLKGEPVKDKYLPQPQQYIDQSRPPEAPKGKTLQVADVQTGEIHQAKTKKVGNAFITRGEQIIENAKQKTQQRYGATEPSPAELATINRNAEANVNTPELNVKPMSPSSKKVQKFYHQTDADFDKFNTKEAWVAPDNTAYYGSKTKEVEYEVKKPFVLDDLYADEYGITPQQIKQNLAAYEKLGGEANPKTFDELRKQGYDTVIESNGDRALLYPDRAKIVKPTLAEAPAPKVASVRELPQRKDIPTVKDAADVHRAGIEVLRQQRDSIQNDLVEAGVNEREFIDAIEAQAKGKKLPEHLKAAAAKWNQLKDDIRHFSEEEYGDLGESYFPHQSKNRPPVNIDELFSSNFDFAQHRSGKLKDYSKDFVQVTDNLIKQAADAKTKVIAEANRRGISVDQVIEERKIAKEIGEAVAEHKPIKDIGERLWRADAEAAAKEGRPHPPREVIEDGLKMSLELTRDKNAVLNRVDARIEGAFERLRHYRNNAAALYHDNVLPHLGDLDAMMDGLARSGIAPDKLNELRGYLEWVQFKKGDKALAQAAQGVLVKNEKNLGAEQLTDFLRTHDVKGRLGAVVNDMAGAMLGEDAYVKNLSDKVIGVITGRFHKGLLGLNVRSALQNITESRRVFNLEGVRGLNAYRKAIGSTEMRTKYGIKELTPEELFNLPAVRTDKKLLNALKKADDSVLFMFNKTEGFKDEVVLRAAEARANKLIKAGKMDNTTQAKTKYVLKYLDDYGVKYGRFGTVGLYNNKLVKLAGQFGQYAAKAMAIDFDMLTKSVGKGSARSLHSDVEARKYMIRMVASNTALYAAASATIGMSFKEAFNLVDARGGPFIDLMADLYAGVTEEMKLAEKEDRDVDTGKLINRQGKRALAGLLPAGNQLINKTGVQAALPEGNPVRGYFGDGAMQDMERGYNPSNSGNARFLAPTDTAEQVKALTFGPYSTKNAREYFKGHEKPLTEKQTEQVNASGNAKGEFEKIHKERDERATERANKTEKPKTTKPFTLTKPKKARSTRGRKPRLSAGRKYRAKKTKLSMKTFRAASVKRPRLKLKARA